MAKKPTSAKRRVQRSIKKSKISFPFVTALIFVVGFASVGLFLLARSFAASGQLFITPANSSIKSGDNFTVSLMISPSTPVDSVEATVSYDPTAVRLVSVDGSASAFPIELQNVSTPNSLTLARGILGGNTTANDSLVANLTFTAIKSSTDTTLSVKGNAAYAGSYTDPSPIGAKISIVSPIAIDPTEAADTTPPTVEIASPVPNATATKFNIYAGASDNSGIAKTELYIDGAVVQSTNTGTVSYNWNVNSKRIAKGQHDITVKAYDNAGNTNSKNLTVYKK